MERSNANRYLDRLKSIRIRRNRQEDQTAKSRTTRAGKTLSILMVAAVLAFMVFTVIGTMARPKGLAALDTTMPAVTGLMQPTTGAAGSLEATSDQYGNSPQAAAVREAPVGSTGGQAAPDAQKAAYQNWDRMIIRTATLQLQVKDVSASVDRVRSLAGAHGGYVASSDSRIEGEYTIATVTLQVPAAQFDDAMTDLRKLGIKATGENVTSADVTEEYTDLQSQLRNLQATEQRIQALMSRAERIEDILTLDRELRTIQSEIERIMGRTNYLSKRAEMSSITVSLLPEIAPVEPVVTTKEGWDPGKVASEAWNASLEMLSRVADVAITLAVFMWWAVPILLLAVWLTLRPRKTTQPPSTPAPDAV